MSNTIPRPVPLDRGHGLWSPRRASTVLMAAAVVSLTGTSAPSARAVDASSRPTPPSNEPLVPAKTGAAQIFTSGEIALPVGEPGQLSVVLVGRLDESGHLPIVVRNNRDHTVYDIHVTLTGTGADGAEVGVAEYYIPTAGVAPGEWVFGQNGIASPGLAQASSLELAFSGSADPGDFVGFAVTAAHLVDGVVEGTVVNTSPVAVGDFVLVNVVCFDGPSVAGFRSAMAEVARSRLGAGEPAHFATTLPVDAATCTAFAIYAIGLPDR